MYIRRNAILLTRHVRYLLNNARRTLLSEKFTLEEEWRKRFKGLHELGIAGAYEWITAVQKKFIGAGIVR